MCQEKGEGSHISICPFVKVSGSKNRQSARQVQVKVRFQVPNKESQQCAAFSRQISYKRRTFEDEG